MHSLKQQPDTAPIPRHAGYVNWYDGPSLGYAVLRIWIGVAFTLFGAMKLSKGLGNFADAIGKQFEPTFLPAWSVEAFARGLPVVELLVGVLVLLGLFTRFALTLGGLTMIALTFGTGLRGENALVGTQLVYAIAFFLLLVTIQWNVLAVDRIVRRRALGWLDITH